MLFCDLLRDNVVDHRLLQMAVHAGTLWLGILAGHHHCTLA